MSSSTGFQLGLNNINPLLNLTKFCTQEAIGSLQLPTTLEQPAKVSRCRLWTEVGLTFLRACPIFFVTSCDFALGLVFVAMSMHALCETRNRHLPNPVQSYKTSVQLLWTVLEKMQKIFIFSPKSPFFALFVDYNGLKITQNRCNWCSK